MTRLADLVSEADDLATQGRLRALLFRSGKSGFIAGADVAAIGAVEDPAEGADAISNGAGRLQKDRRPDRPDDRGHSRRLSGRWDRAVAGLQPSGSVGFTEDRHGAARSDARYSARLGRHYAATPPGGPSSRPGHDTHRPADLGVEGKAYRSGGRHPSGGPVRRDGGRPRRSSGRRSIGGAELAGRCSSVCWTTRYPGADWSSPWPRSACWPRPAATIRLPSRFSMSYAAVLAVRSRGPWRSKPRRPESSSSPL